MPALNSDSTDFSTGQVVLTSAFAVPRHAPRERVAAPQFAHFSGLQSIAVSLKAKNKHRAARAVAFLRSCSNFPSTML